MRRQWNTVNLGGEVDESAALAYATALATVANPIFLDLIAGVRADFDRLGGELYLSANREKLNVEGEVIAGGEPGTEEQKERSETPGRWQTVSLTVRYTVGDEAEAFTIPNDVADCGLATYALAHAADPDFLDALLALKVPLNYFGGQAYIVAHREDDETLGYVFSYEHRGADMLVAKAPESEAEVETEEAAVAA